MWNTEESLAVLKRGTWVTLMGGMGTLMPPLPLLTAKAASFSWRAATWRGSDSKPDLRMPEMASCCKDMVEAGSPEAEVLVMAT